MPRKSAADQFDTLETLQDRSFALFGRYGYEGVSIGDIAKHAGLSKGALYWHFKGKEDLYLHCLNRLHALFDDTIFAPMRAEDQAVPRILLLFRGLTRLLEDPRVDSGIAGYWMTPSRPETTRFVAARRAFEAQALETIKTTLRMGVDQGRFDYGDDLEEMAHAILSLVEACVLPLRQQTREEQHRILGVLARTLFRAYAAADDLLQLTRAI